MIKADNIENELRKKIVELALLQLHKPYEHNTYGPDTFDCTGFVLFTYSEIFKVIHLCCNGYGKSTTTKLMTSIYGILKLFEEADTNKDLSVIKPGDILFFHRQSMNDTIPKIDNRYPGHCGIYLGNGRFIHCSRPKGEIIISNFNENEYWKKVLVATKDIISDILMDKYDIIMPNEFGRRFTVRYKQYMYGDVQGITGFNIAQHGCGPTTIATILSSLGYKLTPEDIAKKMLLDEYGNQLDFYNDLSKNRRGTRDIGYIYLLDKLRAEQICNIEYTLVKVSYEHPELKKEQILDMIIHEYMAMICVGPWNDNYPRTFSSGGHYIAITGVNKSNNEFYVANPNKLGDAQIDKTFSYNTIISNMYTNSFDFLMIKNNKTLKKTI